MFFPSLQVRDGRYNALPNDRARRSINRIRPYFVMLIGPHFTGDPIGLFIKADIHDLGSRGAGFSYRNRAANWNSYSDRAPEWTPSLMYLQTVARKLRLGYHQN
jgi:hypothetical protein